MKLKLLIQYIALKRQEEFPFPDSDNLEAYLEDFVPNSLLKNDTLQQTFSISNYDMEELYQEGYDYYQTDGYTDSSTIFRWLVLLNPFIEKYWMGLAANQQLLHECEKALHSYAIASLLDNKNPYPHYHAYECYWALNNEEEAKKALEQAYQLSSAQPKHSELQNDIEELKKNNYGGIPCP